MSRARKLPVWRIVLDCLRFVLRHWPRLALTGLPVVLLGLIFWLPEDAALSGPIMIDMPEARLIPPAGYFLAMLPWWILIAAASTLALVPVHRLVLLDDRGPHRFLPYRIGLREGRFLVVLLAVWTPPMLYDEITGLAFVKAFMGAIYWTVHDPQLSPGNAVTVFLALAAGSVAVAWLTARFTVALPMAATHRPRSLIGVWRVTRGNGWRVFAVLVIVSLPALLFMTGLDALDVLFSEFSEPLAQEPSSSEWANATELIRLRWWSVTYAVASGFVSWCWMLFEAVAISLAYKWLVGAKAAAIEA